MTLRGLVALGAAALCGLASGVLLDRACPPPAADVSRGGEDAFATGLHPRELPPGGAPLRWTRPRAELEFRRIPPGPAELEVRLAGHRADVTVAVNGILVGRLAPGKTAGRFALPPRRGDRVRVQLAGEGFVAGDGRALGTQLRRIAIHHAPSDGISTPSALLAAGAGAVAAGALAAGAGPAGALAWGAAGAGVCVAALWPQGLWRSGYAEEWVALQLLGSLLAGGFAVREQRRRGTGTWAWAAAIVAWWLLVGAGTSPLMVASDAVFHANQLAVVSGGELFPTSVTQHAEPFRIPYGPLFYVVLSPLYRAGLDAVALVRWGAALGCFAASCLVYAALAGRGPARAGLAVLSLHALPGWFDVLSHGNLSNAFGQAATMALVAWWLSRRHAVLGALAAAVAALSHLSSAIVAGVLSLAMWVVGDPKARRRLLAGIGAGLGAAALYYLSFGSLVAEQLPRLLEGGGQGRGASQGAWDALALQLAGVVTGWGWPAILLALAGWRLGGQQGDRVWRAFWIAGAGLAIAAVVSPLEVRYAYALTLPLAVAAASGLRAAWSAGLAGRAAAVALAAGQLYLAGANLADAVLSRYRP